MTSRTALLTRASSAAARWRWQLSAALAALIELVTDPGATDLDGFSRYGQDILTGHLERVYARPWDQAGPVQLVLSRLLTVGTDGHAPSLAMRIAVDWAILVALRLLVRRAQAGELVANVTAAMAVLWFASGTLWTGHPVEVAIPVLWLAAGWSARGGSWVRAGLLLGVAALVAPWALLAAPVLLVGRFAVAVKACLVAVGASIVGYLPFALTGHFAMLQHVWKIAPDTIVHLLEPHAVTIGWAMRLMQAVVVVGGCALVTVAVKHRPDGVLIAALAAAVMRVVSDPLSLDYYWVPVGVIALIALVDTRGPGRALLAPVALAYVPWLTVAVCASTPWVSTCVAALYVVVVAARARSYREQPDGTALAVPALPGASS